jgi:SAM-dependent methyltransferase
MSATDKIRYGSAALATDQVYRSSTYPTFVSTPRVECITALEPEEKRDLPKLLQDPTVLVKYPRTETPDGQGMALYETYIGTLVNCLARRTPHFAHTIGAFRCIRPGARPAGYVSPKADDFWYPPTASGEAAISIVHVLQEKVPGARLETWLAGSPKSIDVYNILLQLAFALAKAQDKKGFVHNSLTPKNVILRSGALKAVLFQFGSQTYQLEPPGGLVPTVIDFSSARASKKGVGVSYYSNPTIFTPGRDLCSLIFGLLARVNGTPLYAELSWLGEFYRNFFDVSSARGSYEELLERYRGFHLPNDHPLASLRPMDFVSWFRGKQGELFNRLVKTGNREARPFTIAKSSTPELSLEHVKTLKSGAMKQVALQPHGKSYTPTDEEKSYDMELLRRYREYLHSHPVKLLYPNYNFPLDLQYQETTLADPKAQLVTVQEEYTVLSNYVAFLRFLRTAGSDAWKQAVPELYSSKDDLRYDVEVLENLLLYRLYQIATALNIRLLNGQTLGYFREMPALLSWAETLLPPKVVEYLQRVFSPAVNRFLAESKLSPAKEERLYYPPCTLQQLGRLGGHPGRRREVIDAAGKLFFGPQSLEAKRLDPTLFPRGKSDDVQVYSSLRQFRSATGCSFDRGSSRVKDLARVMKNVPPLKVTSYLDFGGGDGAISSAIARSYGLAKGDAFSADVDRWFGRAVDKRFDNVTYLSLREGQPIPLPDQSVDVVTCFQVLHHIKDVEFVLRELYRVCRHLLIIREHDCRDDGDRMVIDVEHSLFELCMEEEIRVRFLNDYEAWYRSKEEWTDLLKGLGFIPTYVGEVRGPTRYYYGVYSRSSAYAGGGV